MRPEQHDIVRALSEARVAVVPCPVVDRALLSERLKGTMIDIVDIVGTETVENGRSCHAHEVCGAHLFPGSKVRFRKESTSPQSQGMRRTALLRMSSATG
jgi:hypothetical protein